MALRRLDHIGITVADLDAAVAFFVGLGLEVEGVVGLEKDADDTNGGLSLPVVQVGVPSLPMADSPYTECPSGVGK